MSDLSFHLVLSAPPAGAVGAQLRMIVAHAAKHPDHGSEFDLATRDIRELPESRFLQELDRRGYDCIVALQDGRFVGLVGFQKQCGGTWHSFAYHVPPEHTGRGIGRALAHAFLDAGYKAGVRHMRFYGGDVRKQLSEQNAETMSYLYHDVVLGNKLGLPFDCEAGHDVGWVILKDRVALTA